jgi:N-acetylglucosamine-6-phosphate deacetylase
VIRIPRLSAAHTSATAARIFEPKSAGLKHLTHFGNAMTLLHQLVKTTSWNQAQSLDLEYFGKLAPGFHADIVLMEKDFSVWTTFVGGVER